MFAHVQVAEQELGNWHCRPQASWALSTKKIKTKRNSEIKNLMFLINRAIEELLKDKNIILRGQHIECENFEVEVKSLLDEFK